MPLSEDGMISREPDGCFNEDYCRWCYAEGTFVYESKAKLLDFLIANVPNPESAPEAERRSTFDGCLSQLKHWKQ